MYTYKYIAYIKWRYPGSHIISHSRSLSISGDHNYDYPPNALGVGIVPPNVQECYEEGSTIDIVSVLTAHHKGHFEVKACPIAPGEVASQACFDEHPLTFEKDMLYGGVKQNEYPGRAYIPLKENTVSNYAWCMIIFLCMLYMYVYYIYIL